MRTAAEAVIFLSDERLAGRLSLEQWQAIEKLIGESDKCGEHCEREADKIVRLQALAWREPFG